MKTVINSPPKDNETVTEKKATAVPPLVDAVVKALQVLDCFSSHETELSLNQLCEKKLDCIKAVSTVCVER